MPSHPGGESLQTSCRSSLRAEKAIHTEIAKNEETDEHRLKGRPFQTDLSDLCDLCV
jgi:hypothetical protein